MSALTENNIQRNKMLMRIISTVRKVDEGLVRGFVLKLAKRKKRISFKEYEKLTLNSYESDLLIFNLSNDALIRVAEHCVRNCQYEPRQRSYNEAVMGLYTPLLLLRFKEVLKNGKK